MCGANAYTQSAHTTSACWIDNVNMPPLIANAWCISYICMLLHVYKIYVHKSGRARLHWSLVWNVCARTGLYHRARHVYQVLYTRTNGCKRVQVARWIGGMYGKKTEITVKQLRTYMYIINAIGAHTCCWRLIVFIFIIIKKATYFTISRMRVKRLYERSTLFIRDCLNPIWITLRTA